VCFLAGSLLPAAAQEKPVYRERTGHRVISIKMWIESLVSGPIIHSVMSDGDTHDVTIDPTGATQSYRFESPARKTAYFASREGEAIRLDGVLKGKPVARRLAIDSRPWYETVEVMLRDYALAGSTSPVFFWIVHPFEAKAYLLQARGEGRESIEVNGSRLEALKVRVGLPGIGSILWNTVYWYRPGDGMFLRYEGVRGFPGTPVTVVELLSGK